MSRDPKTGAELDADGTRTLTEPGPGSDVTPLSSGALDGARFAPGAVLAGRYRIVDLLGRGGMGEVYRAEDLKLGETVALKLLPAELTLDGGALARFHKEVKVARRITHPNVCRMYDIGEAGGLHFLSMEYVDGEDLGSLLHRIGRLPQDKAVDFARQLCAGLAAAHGEGVLHRDLKPGNVMIDGHGRARIMDFGLAGLAEDFQEGELAGTPAYMAPEQLERGRVSFRSDLYSLGLILYETFTGHRPVEAVTRQEIMAIHRSGPPSQPSSIVEGLDPLVEQTVMRCLEVDPGRRPRSALEVSAGLPGGDPLAAALAAGETPSPEMVAAAPEKGTLRPRVAAAWLGAIVASVAVVAWLVPAVDLVSLPKSPRVLEDRARTLLQELGYSAEPVDRAWGWQENRSFLRHLRAGETPGPPGGGQTEQPPGGGQTEQPPGGGQTEQPPGGGQTEQPPRGGPLDLSNWQQRVRDNDPPLLHFWYRQGPETLWAWMFGRRRPTVDDPPLKTPGEVAVMLDPEGRLKTLWVVPPRRQDAGHRPGGPPSQNEAPPDWSPLFAAAGLDPASFAPAAPRWAPPFFVQGRAAWSGFSAGAPIRVEAAHVLGRPVVFEVLAKWEEDARGEAVPGGGLSPIGIMLMVLFVAATTAGLWLARRHLRNGRGDRRGAMRLALFTACSLLLSWLLEAHHQPPAGEVEALERAIAHALYSAGFFWLLYVAFEPFLRRRWPAGIVSWSRLLDGRFRDPLVGRDVLIGGALGTAAAALFSLKRASYQWLGQVLPVPGFFDIWEGSWRGFSGAVAGLSGLHLFASLTNAIGSVFLFVVFYIVLRRKWLAAAGLFVLGAFQAVGIQGSDGPQVVFPLLTAMLLTLAVTRFGVLTAVIYWYAFFLLIQMPLTTDFSSWYFGVSLLAFGLPLFMGVWAFRTAVAGQSLAGSLLLEDPPGAWGREKRR